MNRGYYYMYRPSVELLHLINSRGDVVAPLDCPRTYGHGGFYVYDPNAPKAPEGWVDPYYVVVEDQSYDGNGAFAKISFRRPGVIYNNVCNARRLEQNQWIARCRAVSAVLLGKT